MKADYKNDIESVLLSEEKLKEIAVEYLQAVISN